MNAGELEERFRKQVDDEAQPPLWGSDEFLNWLNEAENEACARARLLVDSIGTAVTYSVSGTSTSTTTHTHGIVTLGSGTEYYDLDERILYLRRVKLASRTIPLSPMDYRDMDQCYPGWEAHTGSVTGYVRGLQTGKFRPYRIPTATDTVKLTTIRLPLVAMSQPKDTPEIATHYHIHLNDWVCFRAYSKKDSQAYDPNLAKEHLAHFEAMFGTREMASALEEEWARNNLPFNEQDGNF